jgi:predicted ATPase/DNA-binding CsgD family transcriptional regulator
VRSVTKGATALSARQAEIAQLVATGKSNREIADVLSLSDRTVETHIAALFSKLGVRSRTELAALIVRRAGDGGTHGAPIARTNLPLELNALLGRAIDVAHIVSALQRDRLVTVTGPGGIGKTRTALAVGAELLPRTVDGVWLIDLAPIGTEQLVIGALAQWLGLAEAPSRTLGDTVLAYLNRRSLVLLIDNCEHVISDAAKTVDALLRTCPGVRVLATSREPLKISGEHVYGLPALRVPTRAAARTLNVAEAEEYAAIVLFAERVRAADQLFVLSEETAPVVADVCLQLDGLPLAIELAAARVKILSVKGLSEKLDQRFRILTGGARSALPRHQTMRAVIDWSYDLLTGAERRLFAHLSIFTGGCALSDAAALWDAQDELGILELLSSLADKSLIVPDLDGPEPRYRMKESSRQYAAEKLAAGGEHAAVAGRHARVYLALAEYLERARDTTPDRACLARVERELENWRAALEWALAGRHDVYLGQRLAGVLYPVWMNCAHAEGRRWVRMALERVSPPTPAGVAALLEYAEATLAGSFAEFNAALASADRALELYQQLGDTWGITQAQYVKGRALLYLGRSARTERRYYMQRCRAPAR